MKKYFLLGLMIAIAPNVCFGGGARYTQLVREKQRKMEELEKCMGATNGLKIAGLSTIGLTAVGVAGNVAQAKKLDEYESGIESKQKELEKVNKDIAEKEAEIKKAKEAEEAAAAIQQDILYQLNNDPAFVQAQREYIASLEKEISDEEKQEEQEIELIEEEESDLPVEVVQWAKTHQDSISSIDKDKNSKQASPQNNVVKSINSKNSQTVPQAPGNNSQSNNSSAGSTTVVRANNTSKTTSSTEKKENKPAEEKKKTLIELIGKSNLNNQGTNWRAKMKTAKRTFCEVKGDFMEAKMERCAGLDEYQWDTTFPYGTIKGTSNCEKLYNNHYNCNCSVKSYKNTSGGKTYTFAQSNSAKVNNYFEAGAAGYECSMECPKLCAKKVMSDKDTRTDIFNKSGVHQ